VEVIALTHPLVELKVAGFLDKLASNEPAPGGGSASALAAAMAAGLVEMVANLTVGREAFTAVEADMQAILGAVPPLRRELTALVDKDSAAFDKVMAARRLPRANDDEKARRRQAIEEATQGAAAVPLRVTALAAEVIALARVVAEKGNPNAISDAGVAGRLGLAGAEGAGLNVRINLSGLKDEAFRREAATEVGRNVDLARRTAAEVAAVVERRMS